MLCTSTITTQSYTSFLLCRYVLADSVLTLPVARFSSCNLNLGAFLWARHADSSTDIRIQVSLRRRMSQQCPQAPRVRG
ncbi:hypothetical protein DFP72DRAFT_885191 [Ephemerocybe angulata]|uniref:Uncharacterized protein n=1 Tax=Ephemerocybe angulata TaxID=980116 RepID=A0A8H6I7R6_9AGAR|nr:hypothetical protein DFP72DRAFT_885191 [Tulosesus angulatus]